MGVVGAVRTKGEGVFGGMRTGCVQGGRGGQNDPEVVRTYVDGPLTLEIGVSIPHFIDYESV